MAVDPPAMGEEMNHGPPTAPRQAASVILVRGGDHALELLLVKRNPAASFMGGVWVFPGGAVDEGDHSGADPHRSAAVRELAEEAGVTGIDADALVRFSRWITPALVRVRFDTHFFVAALPAGQEARPDGEECVDARWLGARSALDAHEAGELQLVFPTIRHLERLGEFRSAEELLTHAREHEKDIAAVLPRVLVAGGIARVVLPGEPGYDATDDPAI